MKSLYKNKCTFVVSNLNGLNKFHDFNSNDISFYKCCKRNNNKPETVMKQVAQWATIAHHGASIMFGDSIIYEAQRQVTLNLKQ